MSLVFGKLYPILILTCFFREEWCFCQRMLCYLKFHICSPTVISILTWPKNDIDRSCVSFNGLSSPVKKNCCSVPWFSGYSMGTRFTFFKSSFKNILSLTVVGLFCRFCQYTPKPSAWATRVGPMCKCGFWSKVEKTALNHDI